MIFEGWIIVVCDKNMCYLIIIEIVEFNLMVGEENIMNVYIYLENNEGMVIVEVMVVDKNDVNILVKGIYYFNVFLNSMEEVEGVKVDVFLNLIEGCI